MTNIVSIDAAASAVVIIDIQEQIAKAMDPVSKEEFLQKSAQLVRAGRLLDIPVCRTEQNPEKLGRTLPGMVDAIGDGDFPVFSKMHFNACREKNFTEYLDLMVSRNVRSVIVAGIEAHVCVLMTATALRERGLAVFIPYECVCSRRRGDAERALSYMANSGIQVLPLESILFSLVQAAGTQQFRSLLGIIK